MGTSRHVAGNKRPVSLLEDNLSLSEWFQRISLMTHPRLPLFTPEVGAPGMVLVTSQPVQ